MPARKGEMVMKYICELCGYEYDEQRGDIARGIPAGTAFAALPEDYFCSGCNCGKEAFNQVCGTVAAQTKPEEATFWRNAKYAADKLESER